MDNITKELSKALEGKIQEYIDKRINEFEDELSKMKYEAIKELQKIKEDVDSIIKTTLKEVNETALTISKSTDKLTSLENTQNQMNEEIKKLSAVTLEKPKFMKKFNK